MALHGGLLVCYCLNLTKVLIESDLIVVVELLTSLGGKFLIFKSMERDPFVI